MSALDDDLVEAVAQAIAAYFFPRCSWDSFTTTRPGYRRMARAVLSVPALRDALAAVAAHEGEMLQLVDQRDEAQEWADRLAACAGGPEVIGEHSNTNNPWANALDLLKANDR